MRCAICPAALFLLPLAALASQQGAPSEIERAVEEFRVQTRSLGLRADSPQRAQRQSRRGLAGYHGRVYWNFRNDFLDAVPHEVTQTGGNKGILRRNQYGFNVSGPLVIPRVFDGGRATFFSLSYEGVKEKIGRSYLRTIPIAPERSGDFAQTVDKAGELLPVFDPAGTRPNPAYDPSLPVSRENLQYLREPFPGNAIPASRLDPVASAALTHYPQPNVAIGPFFQNNYTTYSPEVNNADGMRGKVDHALRDEHRFSFGFSFSNGLAAPAKYFPTIANPGRPDRESRNRGGSLEHTYTLSPSSVNTARVSIWSSVSESLGSEGAGDPFPMYRFEPYLSMGRSFPVSRTASTSLDVSDGLSWRRGTHSFRLSGEWQWYRVNSYWPQYPSGRFDFSEGLTSLPGIVNTGHSFASFLLGLSRFAEASVVEHPSYFRRQRGEVNFRDEWEIRPGLTLYLGLTADISLPRVEKYDRQSTVDLDTVNPANGLPGAVLFAGRGGEGRALQPKRFRLGPWFYIAWSPGNDTRNVIRANYRRNYSFVPVYSGQWGTQGFNGTPTAITQNAQLEPAATLRDGPPEPANPLPDLRPDVANDMVADLMDRTSRQPAYDYYRLSFERQLPASILLTVGLNHTTGRNMLVDNEGANPNAIPLDDLAFRDQLNDETFNRSRRPYPQYQRFDVYSAFPAGSFARTEGYLRFEKRTSQGLSLRGVYEFAKQLDDYSSRDGLQDYYNRGNEWALNPFSDPQTLSLTYMYELPFGPNKPLLNAANWRRYLFEGWSVSGTTSYSGGDPITFRAQFNNTGGVVRALYVDPVPGVDPEVPDRGPVLWFNPAAFVNPPDFATGRLSRTHPLLLNPSRQNHDLSVTKRVALASERAVEFMGTAFNFLNHADWNRPDAEIGTLEAPNLNAGRIIGSQGGRVIQLGVRFSF